MEKIVSAALLSLVTVSTSLLFTQAAKADRVIYCHPVTGNQVSKNSADHPNAYADGYREGEQTARNREAYKPRTAGGEFARGFEDGYFNRSYTGQQAVVPNRSTQYAAQDCDEGGYYTAAPPPAVIYNYPYPVAPFGVYNYPYPSVEFDFGFGGWHHGWGHGGGGHGGWGHRGRW